MQCKERLLSVAIIMGAAYAVIAGGLLCMGGRHAGHPYSSEAYFLMAVARQVLALFVISWLTARLWSLEQMLRTLAGRQPSSGLGR